MSDATEKMIWNDDLSCGIALVDEQHKGLIALVNTMLEQVDDGHLQERESFNAITAGIVSYVGNHFMTEEKIMLDAKLSGYDAHKKEHDNFKLAFAEYIRNYESGNEFALPKFTKFLKEWILSHIAQVDKRCFECLETRQA